MNRPLLKKTLRDLRSRKGSLLSLVMIVAVGIGSFVAMSSVFRDLDGARDRYYRDYRLADFIVDLKRAPEWAVDEVQALPNVSEAQGRVNLPVSIDLPRLDQPISGQAISLPEDHRSILNGVQLRSGSWFSARDDREVILNDAFAKANHLVPGNRIKVLLLDKQHDLLVVGTAMSPEFVYLISAAGGLAPDPARFGVLYLREEFLQESADLNGAFNQIVGKADNASLQRVEETLDLVENRLDQYGVTNTSPSAEQSSVKFLQEELQSLKVMSKVLPGIFLAVAVLVLNVLMGRMVTQQRTIIGTLKALGYSSGALARHYLGYGAAVGMIGGVLGLVLGGWLQAGMVGLYRQFYALPAIDAHRYPDILATGLGISLFFSTLGTYRGLRYAARLEPAAAMHPPPPERGGKVLIERIPWVWNLLTFKTKMVLRAVFRNPFRSLVSVFAVVVSTALVFTALANTDALDYLMRHEFEKVSHQDVSVALREPVHGRAVEELEACPGISTGEMELSVTCDLVNGHREKRTAVTGLVTGHRLRTPLDSKERPIPIPEEGLVLTKKLAEILDTRPGETLRLRPLIGRRDEVRAPVVALVDSYLGLSAYANLEYLSRLIGEERSGNVLLGTYFKGALENPFFDEMNRRPTVIGIGERTRSLDQIEATFGESMGAMIGIMVFFAGLIAFGSVLNATLVSLSEREREVGTLRVLGYSPFQISLIFSGESFLLSLIGIGLGVVAGIGLFVLVAHAYSTEIFRFPVIVYPHRIFQSVGIMLLIVSFAQVLVYRLIRSLKWLEVLKIKE